MALCHLVLDDREPETDALSVFLSFILLNKRLVKEAYRSRPSRGGKVLPIKLGRRVSARPTGRCHVYSRFETSDFSREIQELSHELSEHNRFTIEEESLYFALEESANKALDLVIEQFIWRENLGGSVLDF